MLDEYKIAIRDKLLEMDEELQKECYAFIVKNTKPQADTNNHDDVIIADAICLQMLKENTQKRAMIIEVDTDW